MPTVLFLLQPLGYTCSFCFNLSLFVCRFPKSVALSVHLQVIMAYLPRVSNKEFTSTVINTKLPPPLITLTVVRTLGFLSQFAVFHFVTLDFLVHFGLCYVLFLFSLCSIILQRFSMSPCAISTSSFRNIRVSLSLLQPLSPSLPSPLSQHT